MGAQRQPGQQPAADQLAEHPQIRGGTGHGIGGVAGSVGHQPPGGLPGGGLGVGQVDPDRLEPGARLG